MLGGETLGGVAYCEFAVTAAAPEEEPEATITSTMVLVVEIDLLQPQL